MLLDEIGELPLPLQAKLLRVIETREVMRVGAVKARTIDVRFLAATNRVLEDEVARGAFRQDLYYRLNGISLLIPPLRARVDEIEPLARSFVENAAKLSGPAGPEAVAGGDEAAAVVRVAGKHPRAAQHHRTRAAAVDGRLDHARGSAAREDARHAGVDGARARGRRRARRSHVRGRRRSTRRAGLDYERIVESLSLCSGNQTRAAKLLGMSRRTFCARLKAYNIPRPRVSDGESLARAAAACASG